MPMIKSLETITVNTKENWNVIEEELDDFENFSTKNGMKCNSFK